MTVEQVHARPATALAPSRQAARPAARMPMCVVVHDLAEGEGAALLRNLRARGSTRVVLLARRAGRREIVRLLQGGLRGAVAAEPSGLADQVSPQVPQQPGPRLEPRRDERGTLSERELGVLSLVSQGNTNRSVGEQLGLSALTVKSHLSRISRKLGTGDRAELVAIAIRRGMLD